MTTRILSGTYAAGYAIASHVTVLSITSTGSVEAPGLYTLGDETLTVVNAGRIAGSEQGVLLTGDAASVTNGGESNTTASITSAEVGLAIVGVGTVVNFATITDTATGRYDAVYLGKGGQVTNGSAADAKALIKGGNGVGATTGAATLANFGSIVAVNYAVEFFVGGRVTNGSSTDTSAVIQGGEDGVFARNGAGAVSNFGTIAGGVEDHYAGVALDQGGSLVNGAIDDDAALITGELGVYLREAAVVTNYGTITGDLGHVGVGVELAGGTLINGAVGDTKALIGGRYAVQDPGTVATVVNFGTINGGKLGVYLAEGGVITNGGTADTTASIEAVGYAVSIDGPGIVTNFGTLGGVDLHSTSVVLNAESGSVFLGTVSGGYATIHVVAGVADFEDGLRTGGTISGAGTLAITGGYAYFGASPDLSVAVIKESGADTSVVFAVDVLTLAHRWDQTGGVMSVVGGDRVNFTGAGDSISGWLEGAGAVAFVGGSDTLSDLYVEAKTAIINGASVTLSGQVLLEDTLIATTTDLTIAAGGATLSGSGIFDLTNHASNAIVGASAGASLTNDLIVEGAGDLGDGKLRLTNSSTGIIQAIGSAGLTIDTGGATVVNAGLIESSSAGGATIASAIDNTGRLIASSGILTVKGAVSGTGYGQVVAGTLDFTSAFDQQVVFAASSTGALELAHGQQYSATISGFALTGATRLDLADIAYAAGTTRASYSGTASGGVLTVTSGSEVARIHFAGDYLASTWTLASDGHGGTRIVDPVNTAPHPPVQAPPIHGFAQAMAGMRTAAPASSSRTPEAGRMAALALIAPRGCAA